MDKIVSKELRKEKIRNTKTELILDSALRVLSQKGYHETRLEDIAEMAGFSKSALYRYYKDKEEIFFTIAIREREKVFSKLSSGPHRLCEDRHISENLRSLLRVSLEVLGENFSFLLTLNSFQVIALADALQKQGTLMKIEKEFLTSESKIAEVIIRLFNSAKAKGEITTSLDSKTMLEFYHGILFTRVKRWHQQAQMGDIDSTVEEMVSFLAKGLGYALNTGSECTV